MTTSTPFDTATQAFRAIDSGDIDGLVSLTHPAALAQFKRQQAAMATLGGARFVAGDQEFLGPPSMLRPVYKVNSMEEFMALPDRVVLARSLRTRWRHRVSPPEREILGVLSENDSAAHIVFRETATTPKGESPWADMSQDETIRVLTTGRIGDTWAVMLNGGIIFNDDGSTSFGWGDDEDEEGTA